MKEIVSIAKQLQELLGSGTSYRGLTWQLLQRIYRHEELRRAAGWVTRKEMRNEWLISTEEAKRPSILGVEQTHTYEIRPDRRTYLFKASDLDAQFHRIEELSARYGDLNWTVIRDELVVFLKSKEEVLRLIDYTAGLGDEIQGKWDVLDQLDEAGVLLLKPFVFPKPVTDLAQSLLDYFHLWLRSSDPLHVSRIIPFLLTIAGHEGWKAHAAEETGDTQNLDYLGVSLDEPTDLTGEKLKAWVFERFEAKNDAIIVKDIPNFLRWALNDERWTTKVTVLTI